MSEPFCLLCGYLRGEVMFHASLANFFLPRWWSVRATTWTILAVFSPELMSTWTKPVEFVWKEGDGENEDFDRMYKGKHDFASTSARSSDQGTLVLVRGLYDTTNCISRDVAIVASAEDPAHGRESQARGRSLRGVLRCLGAAGDKECAFYNHCEVGLDLNASKRLGNM